MISPGSGANRPRTNSARTSRPLRILHVCRRYQPFVGGTEKYVHDLALAQLQAGHKVTIFTLDRDVTGPRRGLPRQETLDGLEVVRVPGRGSAKLAVTYRPDCLVRAIRGHDVVHFHDLRFALTTGVLGASLARRPSLFHTHGLIFHSGSASKWKRFAIRFYFGPLLRLGRVECVASSEADRALLLRDAPYLDARTATCPNAIPLSPLSSIARTPVPGRVVSIGRIVANKSLSNLIRALARIDDVDWSLVLAGQPDPTELSRIEAEIDNLGLRDRVTFVLDFAEDALRPLLASAALAAFPSKGEGFGISLLEAMAAGVPVVANRIPAHEALLGEELADRLVDFESPEGASVAIRNVLEANESEIDALSERLRSRAADYDIARLKNQIDELYERLGVRSHAGHR